MEFGRLANEPPWPGRLLKASVVISRWEVRRLIPDLEYKTTGAGDREQAMAQKSEALGKVRLYKYPNHCEVYNFLFPYLGPYL